MDLHPSAPFKNKEQDKRQKRYLSPAKPISVPKPLTIPGEWKQNLGSKKSLTFFFSFVLSLVSLARRVPSAEAWHPEFQTRAPRAKRWVCPLPQLSRLCREALRGTLLKRAAAGRVLRLLSVPSWPKYSFTCTLRTPSSLLVDKIPIKQSHPQLFLLWGRVCTLELSLEALHSLIEEWSFTLCLSQTWSHSTGLNNTGQEDPCWELSPWEGG